MFKRKILFLMDLPKPIHGMSNVNLAVLRAAEKEIKRLIVIKTAPSYAEKYFGTKLWGIIKIFHSGFCIIQLFLMLLRSNSETIVYRPIYGGLGQLYDIFYIGLCRVFRANIFIHHHSFNYLNSYSQLFSMLNKLAGKQAVHIVLGSRMGDLLSTMYSIQNKNIREISNIAFFNAGIRKKSDTKVLVIGHLANLCVAKGIDAFAGLCYELKKRGILFKAFIAGPYADVDSENIVLKLLSELDEVEYLGSVYGADKNRFFQSLDAFIFPSKYKNEAEPLVLYEAAQFGVLNIGTQQGCMQEVIGELHGYSTPDRENIVVELADTICSAIKREEFDSVNCIDRVSAFEVLQEQAQKSLNNLICEMREINVSRT